MVDLDDEILTFELMLKLDETLRNLWKRLMHFPCVRNVNHWGLEQILKWLL